MLAFGLYSAWVVCSVGYVGILRSHFGNAGGIQVLLDLVIACSIGMSAIVHDARSRGNPWPWVALTLPLGSIGLLGYHVFGRRSAG